MIDAEFKDADSEAGEEGGQSPMPTSVPPVKIHPVETFSFYEALKKTMDGKKITRVEWKDQDYYGLIKDALLKLHKPDGRYYDWIISDGDIVAEDWTIIN